MRASRKESNALPVCPVERSYGQPQLNSLPLAHICPGWQLLPFFRERGGISASLHSLVSKLYFAKSRWLLHHSMQRLCPGSLCCVGCQARHRVNTKMNKIVIFILGHNIYTLLYIKYLPWWLRWSHFVTLGWEDPLEKGMATHSCSLAWRFPWTEEPGRL